jgi:hypothetical protein
MQGFRLSGWVVLKLRDGCTEGVKEEQCRLFPSGCIKEAGSTSRLRHGDRIAGPLAALRIRGFAGIQLAA